MAIEQRESDSPMHDEPRAEKKPWETPVLRRIQVDWGTEGKLMFPVETNSAAGAPS